MYDESRSELTLDYTPFPVDGEVDTTGCRKSRLWAQTD